MYQAPNNSVPGDLRRGRMHHAAITVQTPLAAMPQNPAELGNKLAEDADFVLETAIGTMISQLDGRKATLVEIDRYKKLIAKNVQQKIRLRCYKGTNTGQGPWQVK